MEYLVDDVTNSGAKWIWTNLYLVDMIRISIRLIKQYSWATATHFIPASKWAFDSIHGGDSDVCNKHRNGCVCRLFISKWWLMLFSIRWQVIWIRLVNFSIYFHGPRAYLSIWHWNSCLYVWMGLGWFHHFHCWSTSTKETIHCYSKCHQMIEIIYSASA